MSPYKGQPQLQAWQGAILYNKYLILYFRNSTWWDRRTAIEKGLIIVLSMTLIFSVIIACLYAKSLKTKQSIS